MDAPRLISIALTLVVFAGTLLRWRLIRAQRPEVRMLLVVGAAWPVAVLYATTEVLVRGPAGGLRIFFFIALAGLTLVALASPGRRRATLIPRPATREDPA